MSARFGLLAGLFLAILFTAGCASMSGLSTQASLQNADALAAEKTLAGTATSVGAWPATDWWRTFEDHQLDELIDEALSGSPTLKIADARTRPCRGCLPSMRKDSISSCSTIVSVIGDGLSYPSLGDHPRAFQCEG